MRKTHQSCKKGNTYSSLFWIVSVCIIVALLIFINKYILTITFVSGNSMYPTIESNTVLLVDRIHKTYINGDIILAQLPAVHSGKQYIIKRVIAVEGDEVIIEYDKNSVIVNHKEILEPYINSEEQDPMRSDGIESVTYIVPSGCLFIMGDNRNYSVDSRSTDIGFIPKENVIGKVIIP